MKTKVSIILLLFLLSSPIVSAETFHYVAPDAFRNPVVRFFSRIWECKWHTSCYQKLGSFTTISSSDQLSNFPTTYNANLELTIETSTTSLPLITTLAGLTSAANLSITGTLSSTTYRGNTIPAGYGGTSSSTLSANRLLFGNGTAPLQTITFGSAGQALVSNGAGTLPSFQSLTTDTTTNYNWTGAHRFGSTISASNTVLVANGVAIGTTSPSFINSLLEVTGGANITGTSTVGTIEATSSIVASNFNQTATSTFQKGIAIGDGCFYAQGGCLNTKTYVYATSTPPLFTNTYTDQRTIGFQATYLSGTAFLDGGTDGNIFCTFSWDKQTGTRISLGQIVATGLDSSATGNLCLANQGTDDMDIDITANDATTITIRFRGTAGNYNNVTMNAIVIGN